MLYILFLALGAAGLALDQWLKAYVTANIPLGQAQSLLPGVVELRTVHNYGAAWSSFSGSRWLLVGVTCAIVVFVTVLLIRRDYAYHRFSTGRVPVGFTAADSEDTLRHLGLSYRMERFSLEFGQPLRSLEDARRFFRLYDRSGAGEPPLHRLVPGPGPEFPYYLPNRKELCLLAVEIPAMEEA